MKLIEAWGSLWKEEMMMMMMLREKENAVGGWVIMKMMLMVMRLKGGKCEDKGVALRKRLACDGGVAVPALVIGVGAGVADI